MEKRKDDKTKIIQISGDKPEETNVIAGPESQPGQTVVISDLDAAKNQTMVIDTAKKPSEKTVEMFDIGSVGDGQTGDSGADLERSIDSGFYKDPISFEKTIQETDFDLKKLFPDRTKSGHVKINRNFLNDAEPFSLERINQETRNITEGVFTGFNFIDKMGALTSYKPLLLYGLPRREIVLVLLNILINLAKNYPNKHFLYYTYNEYRIDMELKLINALSETAFNSKHNFNNNLEQWIQEIGSSQLETLIERVKSSPDHNGLRHFLTISDRIHIVDSKYGFDDLLDSIRSFSKVFDVGAVMIDNGEEIRIPEGYTQYQKPKVKSISDNIRKMSLELNYPFFYGYNAIDDVRKEGFVNLNFVNYSTRIYQVRKEFPNIHLIDTNSNTESVYKVDYDLFKVSESD